MILTLFLVIAACFAVTYKHNFDSKRALLHVDDNDTTRIAILDRSGRWRRVDSVPVGNVAAEPEKPVEPEGDGLDKLTVAQLKELGATEGVEGLKEWKKADWVEGIRSTRALAKAVEKTLESGAGGETMTKLA